MTDKEYAADCIEYMRNLAVLIRGKYTLTDEDADKLDEIAASLQVDTQEDT